MSYGGIGVVRELVSKLGLAGEINRRLTLLKKHLPYHESDHVLNIAYNLLCGGTRLEDLGSLRNNAAYMDALGAKVIPSPTAAGDFTRRFGEGGVVELQEAFNAVRPRLWRGRGRDLLAPVAYVDVDGTLAPTLGDKKDGMDMSYKGVWGYHPLVWPTLPRQPAGQRRPRGRGGVDRQGHRPRGAPRRTGVRARGHGLLADGQLRPLERGGGLHLRLRLATGHGQAGRGSGGG